MRAKLHGRSSFFWQWALACIIGLIVFLPVLSLAKVSEDQDQIILLNDAAAALEDSQPGLSKSLTQIADEKEKAWEDKNANKPVLPAVITDKTIKESQDETKLLKAAAKAIQLEYPLIAKGLDKMAKDINRTIENEK